MHRQILVSFKIGVIISPVMRQIGPYQDDIPGIKAFNVIAYELRPAALMKIDKLYFRMIMPAVVDERIPVLPDAERMRSRLWDFQ